MRSFTLKAQISALRFALRRGKRDLDPLQTYLRDAIFNLGCHGLNEGEYNSDSYENRKVPKWCYQIDRIERGLSPIVKRENDLVNSTEENSTEEKDEVEYSMEFYRQLREQTMGPWRRALFTEVGGGEASTSDLPSDTESNYGGFRRYTLDIPVDTDSDPDDFYLSDHDSDTDWFVPPV